MHVLPRHSIAAKCSPTSHEHSNYASFMVIKDMTGVPMVVVALVRWDKQAKEAEKQ
jgi:hypothetical protein